MNSYLVIRQGRRWNDIFRLTPGQAITIGRASTNAIVIPEEMCSRVHAEISEVAGDWVLRDLQSRNGTLLNGLAIEKPTALKQGDTIQVGSGQMEFVQSLAGVFEPSIEAAKSGTGGSVGQTEAIIARCDHSGILGDGPYPNPTKLGAKSDIDAVIFQRLFQLAFDLSSAQTAEEAADVALKVLIAQSGADCGGVFLFASTREENLKSEERTTSTKTPTTGPDLILLATQQQGIKGYRRPSDYLVKSIAADGEGLLARNISGDKELLSQSTSAALQATSLIVAPIRHEGRVLGMLHVYSSRGEHELTQLHLQIAIAIGDTIAIALKKIASQQILEDSLQSVKRKAQQLQEQLSQQSLLVGESQPLQKVKDIIARAAPTNATILVRGESGVGKELVAQLVHEMSPRKDGPFLCVNCAALSPTLLESELFGHEKGAFTGAIERKIGRFEAAHGGTLMLDEVGEMTPEIQTKFLRVLETRTIERIGSHKPIPVDVRIVSATNRDLEEAVQDGLFRSDLYFRLKVIQLNVPPLRDRSDDIPVLARHFLKRFSREIGRRLEGFTKEALEAMANYAWPGNVRELKNVIERAVVLCGGAWITVDDLALDGLRLKREVLQADGTPYKPISLDDMEREHILSTLRHTRGNKSRTASILGIERSTLDRKLQKFSLTPEHWKDVAED
jgi:transcriptional regulator with GAF, ATPase, and Fis domain